ncbi:MAG: acyl-CoA thioesterase [Halorientalis sp.]
MTAQPFEFVTDVPIRYRDLDPWDHVNNAVYATYLEQGRLRYMDAVIDDPLESRDFVLAHLELDFEQSVTFEDSLTVAVRASDVGRSSLSLVYEVRADDVVAATGETTQVHVGEDGATPLPDAWRAAITTFEPALE